jgi:hypothetical protein
VFDFYKIIIFWPEYPAKSGHGPVKARAAAPNLINTIIHRQMAGGEISIWAMVLWLFLRNHANQSR